MIGRRRLTGLRPRFKRHPAKADEHPQKHVPHSLTETLRAIRLLAGLSEEGGTRRKGDFIKQFTPYLEDTLKRYPGSIEKMPDDVGQYIDKIEGNAVNIYYFQLRAFAEYAGIPVAMLILYAHVLGDVANGGDAEAIDALLSSVERGVSAIREGLLSGPKDKREMRRRILIDKTPIEDGVLHYNALGGLLNSFIGAIKAK